MEDQLERKDVVGVVAKEPVKTEGLVPSPDTSERSEGASSPPPNCSICLGKLINTSFTDSCLHQFCFTCLLQWSKIKTECPLCKQIFKSIIHNVRSEEDYDQYHVPRELASQLPSGPQVEAAMDINFELFGGAGDVGLRRFVYRTTMMSNRRYGVFGGLLNPDQVARRAQIPNIIIPSGISREERRFRRVNPTGYRRNVYRLGEWSNLLPDIYGRFRECSAEYYRRHPDELNRLIPWINRELQTLLNANEPHIAYVLRVVMDALTRYDVRGAEFRDTVRPYFGQYTDHFAHELLNYARTNFDLIGFDQYVTYPTRGHGVSNDYVTRVISPSTSSSSTSSDDSDVRVIDQTIDVSRTSAEIPSVGPHLIDMPGPSTVGEQFHLQRMLPVAPDILTISSSSSSSEECAVVGYVKPRHERTPEIIELVTSDAASEPSNNNDASSRTPPIRENEVERAGPSREERRRTARESSQRSAKRTSLRRWSTTSSSSFVVNDDSASEYSRHRRKKTFHHNESRPRVRDHARRTRSRAPSERQRASRSTSKTRKRQASNSTVSDDQAVPRNLRHRIRNRAQILRDSLVPSDTESSSSSNSSTSSSNSSAASSDDWRSRKFRTSLKARKIGKHGQTKMTTRLMKDSSSSEIESNERSNEDECRVRRSRRKILTNERTSTPTTMIGNSEKHDKEPVHATILRKDATNPDEWYIKKKSCHGKSRSSSSSSTETGTKVRASRRITISVYKERREAANPGCSGERETSRMKNDRSFVDKEETENDSSSDVTNESNSRCSAISGRTRAKERSRGKSCQKKRKIVSESSESSDSSRERRPNTSKSLTTRNDHGKRKYQDSRDDQSGRKEDRTDHGRKKDRGGKSVGYEKRNERHRDQEERKKEKSKSAEDKRVRSRNDSYGRRYDQEERCEAKKYDREGRNEAKKHDQEGRNDSRTHEQEGRNESRKHDQEGRNETKKHDQEPRNEHTKKHDEEPKNDREKRHDQDLENDRARKHDQEQRNDHTKKYDQIAGSENTRKDNDQTLRHGLKRKDHVRRNDDSPREDDQRSRNDAGAGSSRHSQNDKDSPSKDKYKRKKKLKRRRSRSESKNESRNTRYRMARSSSCTAPTTNRDP